MQTLVLASDMAPVGTVYADPNEHPMAQQAREHFKTFRYELLYLPLPLDTVFAENRPRFQPIICPVPLASALGLSLLICLLKARASGRHAAVAG